jgi:hypothetical protein
MATILTPLPLTVRVWQVGQRIAQSCPSALSQNFGFGY